LSRKMSEMEYTIFQNGEKSGCDWDRAKPVIIFFV
jgi:hypothetical protein